MFERSFKKNVQVRHESSQPATKRLNRKGSGVYKILLSEIHKVSVATLKEIGKLELRHDYKYE
jgi:hypothetical protein